MKKTYSALIERLKKSYSWHISCAETMDRQHNLNDGEKKYIIEHRAIAAQLARIIKAETGEAVTA